MFGATNLIARIYVFTLTEYLRIFGRIRGLSGETDKKKDLKKVDKFENQVCLLHFDKKWPYTSLARQRKIGKLCTGPQNSH